MFYSVSSFHVLNIAIERLDDNTKLLCCARWDYIEREYRENKLVSLIYLIDLKELSEENKT